MRNPCCQIYRVSRFCYVRGWRRTARCFDLLNRLIFSVWLPGAAEIGPGLTVGYWGLGIVVHHDSVIGRNCWICQHVTIGRNFSDTHVPRIGHNVYIGPNSVIFGEISIGDNVFIGSNSVVNESVPANCTVVGNPMRIVRRNNEHNHLQLRHRDKSAAG